MQTFREKVLVRIMSAFTALIFLNMGFFLIEVKVLGLDKNRQLMENISSMIAGAAFEEERDSAPQSSGFNPAEEEYLPGHHSPNYAAVLFLIGEHSAAMLKGGNLEKGYLKNFCPPPEL